jgi:hypothetical protein
MDFLYTYVLRLQEGKWYVGKTRDPANGLSQVRRGEHHAGLYAEVWSGQGFVICSAEIQRWIASVNDLCFNCGDGGHSVGTCPFTVDEGPSQPEPPAGSGNTVVALLCAYCGDTLHLTDRCPFAHELEAPVCRRCGRDTHDESTCFANTHMDGGPPQQDVMYLHNDDEGAGSSSGSMEALVCTRCGRGSHYESTCYAKTHADGGALNVNRRADRNVKVRDIAFLLGTGEMVVRATACFV